jgi:hypothetical protein
MWQGVEAKGFCTIFYRAYDIVGVYAMVWTWLITEMVAAKGIKEGEGVWSETGSEK